MTMYEGLLEQNQVIMRQKNAVENQLGVYKNNCEKYQEEVKMLRMQVLSSKQVIDRMSKEIINMELQKQVRKIPNDNLAKLE